MIQSSSALLNQNVLKKQMAYEQKSKQILQKTLLFSGLKMESEVDYRAVKIYEIDYIHEIYTKNQQSNLPHIVLLHGFGGTGMTFFRMFKRLKQNYIVHALDSLGVGHSSKGTFKQNFTYQEARHYFIDSIQKWREALNIQSFTLVGHSFGGYLAACYTETYPQRVNRLIMLSPAGVTEKTPEQVQQQLKIRAKKVIFGQFFNFFAESIYNLRIKPSHAMGTYVLGDQLIKRIVEVRLKMRQQERQAWKQYFRDLSKKQAASQSAFYIIFQWPLKPKHTIEAMINRMNFNKPIQFYYGQYDWMDSKGAVSLAQKYQSIKFDVISKADHQLIFDNPDEICCLILLRRTIQQLSQSYHSHQKKKITQNQSQSS